MNEEQSAINTIDWSKYTIPELEGFLAEIEEEVKRMQKAKKQEIKRKVLEDIKAAGFTPDELGFGSIGKRTGKKKVSPVKYRNPEQTDETWAGRGKKPKWLTRQLETGKKLEDFAV